MTVVATPPPAAFGAPVLSARMRCAHEDFRVGEIDAFQPSGSGEHVLLSIEKRGMNTAFVADLLARWAGVPAAAVGYAGLKDRHAVTVQRFTVQVPGREPPPVDALEAMAGDAPGQSLRVLASARHARKLPRGALAGNRFVLVLREVRGDRAVIDARLHAIREAGCPNAFGGQRFGHGGGNLAAALAMFDGRRVRREQRGLLLSAARSELFNRVLAARVEDGSWDRGLEGEVWMLEGSHSVFGPEPGSSELAARAAASDIHPTGPLWGRGTPRVQGAARDVELQALSGDDAERFRAGLEAAGLRQERRALRARVADLAWHWPGGEALELAFSLPAGSYATALLAQLGAVEDAGRP
ncbi:tRNA pseudouridine(13) synthase TruD [Luteimonas pelagia]